VISQTLTVPGGELRSLVPDDAEAITRACTDPEIARWTQVPQPYRLEHAVGFIADRGGDDHVWAIDVDGLCGVIGVRSTRATLPGPITEVGYWVARWARGRGVATAALSAVRDELALHGFQRIDWAAVAGNDASMRVAVKAGFTIEGFRRQGLVQRGRLVDVVVGGWTAEVDIPELVAGQWQVQPVQVTGVEAELRPRASNALGVWVARTSVGGHDSGYILATRTVSGVRVDGVGAPEPAIRAVERFLLAQGMTLTDEPLPAGWL
jgi:RimJ/RimL family protein N-acetyltransferase